MRKKMAFLLALTMAVSTPAQIALGSGLDDVIMEFEDDGESYEENTSSDTENSFLIDSLEIDDDTEADSDSEFEIETEDLAEKVETESELEIEEIFILDDGVSLVSEEEDTAATAEEVDSGTCGDNLTWTLDSEGTLTISGTGDMTSYTYGDASLWGIDKDSIVSVIFMDGVTSIGDYAFYGCTSLTSVTIPDSVTSIEKWVFGGCTSLTSITIPDSVISIGDDAFYGCTSLTSITIPDDVISIGNYAFFNCESLTSITIPGGVTSIGGDAFGYCTSLTSVTILDGVTNIRNYAFHDCISLTSITIPDSVTSIESYAFYGCTSLMSITISDSVTCIESYAFYYCTSLTSVTIPDSVTCIEERAFDYCTSLTSVTIPGSVIEIGKLAFSHDTSLTDVYYTASEEDWAAITIESGNTYLTDAVIHYNSNGSDEDSENDNGITVGDISVAVLDVNEGNFTSDFDKLYVGDMVTFSVEVTVDSATTLSFDESYWKCADADAVSFSAMSTMGPYASEEDDSKQYYIVSITADLSKSGSYTVAFSYPDGGESSIKISVNEESESEEDDLSQISSLTPECGYEYSELSNLTCKIVFDNMLSYDSFDSCSSTDHYIYLMPYDSDEENTENAICKIDLLSSASSNGTFSVYQDENGNAVGLTLNFYCTLTASEKYYILFDSDVIVFEDGSVFTGIHSKNSWNFQTVPVEYSTITNTERSDGIPTNLYSLLFKPFVAEVMEDRESGKEGLCFGYDYAVAAWNEDYSSIHATTVESLNNMELSSSIINNYTFLDYIQLGQLYQYTSSVSKEINNNKNDYAKLYQAICDYQDGSGNPIIITIHKSLSGSGHALYPIGIISEDDSSIMISVFDCNDPYNYEAGFNSYLSVLTLKKEEGEIAGWSYSGYEEKGFGNYITFACVDETLDELVGNSGVINESSYLVYTDTDVEDSLSSESLWPVSNCNSNDEETSDDNEKDYLLYWTEDTNITRMAEESSDNSFIGFTDGYITLSAEASLNASVSLDLIEMKEEIVFSDDSDDNSYVLSYRETDDDLNETQMIIEGNSSEYVSVEKTDDSLIITSDDLTDITIKNIENENTDTYTLSTDSSSVLIETDENGDCNFYIDADNSGNYDTKLEEENTDISSCTVTIVQPSFTYDGTAKTPDVTVTNGSTLLTNGTDYTVSYSNNTNAGTAKVTVTGKGKYTGTVEKTFSISKASQTVSATAAASSIVAGKTTTITASGQGTVTYSSSDATIATVDRNSGLVTGLKPGTVTITATAAGTNNYNAASKTVTVTVTLGAGTISSLTNTAKGITVKWEQVTGASGYYIYRKTSSGKYSKIKTITSGSTISYTDTAVKSKNGTTYTYKVVPFSGSTTGAFTAKTMVRLTSATLSSVKNSAPKKVAVKWKKVTKVSGYQIQYSTSKTFKSGNKTKKVSGASKTGVTLSGLKKGKTYYVRIRTYKKVNGKTYYSAWSSKKTVKIKK